MSNWWFPSAQSPYSCFLQLPVHFPFISYSFFGHLAQKWGDSRKMTMICLSGMPWGNCPIESGGHYSDPIYFWSFGHFLHPRSLTWSFGYSEADKFHIIVLFFSRQGLGSSGLYRQWRRKTPKLWSHDLETTIYFHWSIFSLVPSWWPFALIF